MEEESNFWELEDTREPDNSIREVEANTREVTSENQEEFTFVPRNVEISQEQPVQPPTEETQPLFQPDLRWLRDHPQDQIIGEVREGIRTRSSFRENMFSCFLSQEEPKTIEDTLADPDWIEAMQEELHQFERNQV